MLLFKRITQHLYNWKVKQIQILPSKGKQEYNATHSEINCIYLKNYHLLGKGTVL